MRVLSSHPNLLIIKSEPCILLSADKLTEPARFSFSRLGPGGGLNGGGLIQSVVCTDGGRGGALI